MPDLAQTSANPATTGTLPALADLRESGLSPVHADDIRLLDALLSDVLREQEGAESLDLLHDLAAAVLTDDNPDTLFERVPGLSKPARTLPVLRAFTVLFQLLNTAEQKEIVRANRARQANNADAVRPESVRDAVQKLKNADRKSVV